MTKVNTRDALLDAAEYLMARQGYANTSLREITAKANANLAAVNYHFGSKEGLVSNMLARRLTAFNGQRLALLENEISTAAEANRKPDAEVLLRAFVEPALAFFRTSDGGGDFLRIFSHIHADPDDIIRQEFLKHMLPVFIQFFDAFKSALPGLDPATLVLRLFFCIGALSHGAHLLVDVQMQEQMPEMGLPPLADADALIAELVGFVVRGMEAK